MAGSSKLINCFTPKTFSNYALRKKTETAQNSHSQTEKAAQEKPT
jgi:hypothetical protein